MYLTQFVRRWRMEITWFLNSIQNKSQTRFTSVCLVSQVNRSTVHLPRSYKSLSVHFESGLIMDSSTEINKKNDIYTLHLFVPTGRAPSRLLLGTPHYRRRSEATPLFVGRRGWVSWYPLSGTFNWNISSIRRSLESHIETHKSRNNTLDPYCLTSIHNKNY